jgi:hypothetical protein
MGFDSDGAFEPVMKVLQSRNQKFIELRVHGSKLGFQLPYSQQPIVRTIIKCVDYSSDIVKMPAGTLAVAGT